LPAPRQFLFAAVAAVSLFLFACDKPAASNTTSTETANSAPTTEPSQDLALVTMPLVLSVPHDWSIAPRDNPSYLEGSAPDGKLQISFSMLDAMSPSAEQLYVSAAIDQSRKHPAKIFIRQSTTSNGFPILERITYSGRTGPSTEPSPATTEPSEPLSWSLVLFLPFQQKFIPCRFDLLKLTQQQYDDDRPFIESLLDTARPNDLAAFK
jgi:hypothetical protein